MSGARLEITRSMHLCVFLSDFHWCYLNHKSHILHGVSKETIFLSTCHSVSSRSCEYTGSSHSTCQSILQTILSISKCYRLNTPQQTKKHLTPREKEIGERDNEPLQGEQRRQKESWSGLGGPLVLQGRVFNVAVPSVADVKLLSRVTARLAISSCWGPDLSWPKSSLVRTDSGSMCLFVSLSGWIPS